MTAAFGALIAVTLLIVTAPAQAQDAAGTSPDKGAVPTQPVGDNGGATVGAEDPKVDPKLLLDAFNRLTRPRAAAKPPPAVSAPAPTHPGAVSAATPVAPVIVAPAAPAHTATVAAPVAVPRAVRPRSVTSAKPPSPVEPRPAPPVAIPVAERPSPTVAAPTGPVVPAPKLPVAISQSRETPAPDPAPPSYFLAAGTLLPLIGLLVALAAIVAGLSFSRARRIARTRAALALSPRLDLSMGDFSLGGLALAGPSVAIRARLDPPEARGG